MKLNNLLKNYHNRIVLKKFFLIWTGKKGLGEKGYILSKLYKKTSDFDLKTIIPNQPYNSFHTFLEKLSQLDDVLKHIYHRLQFYSFEITKPNGEIITSNHRYKRTTECLKAMNNQWDGNKKYIFKIYADLNSEEKGHIVARYRPEGKRFIITSLEYVDSTDNSFDYVNIQKVIFELKKLFSK